MKNTATTGDFSTITSNGLNVDATMTHLGGDALSSFDAEAHSGAGSSDVGIAGSVALNIISDQTTAIVYGHTVVSAGTGDVTVLAENLTEANASAISDAEGGSSSVGVGASVALNILTPMHTYAQVLDGAVLTGGHNITVQATASQNNVTTTVHAGSAGGDAISPAVAIAIVVTDTNASVGTGTGLSASGNVTIQASYSGTVTTSGDATAAGSSVAVGAIVGLNIVAITTAGTTTRNIVTTGGFVTIGSSSQIAASSIVEASAKGESDKDHGGKSADSQANDQVKNNKQSQNSIPGGSSTSLPSANDSAQSGDSQAGGQTSGGESGGGVGVAAAVSLNWVTMTNTASIAPSLTVSATGAVSVLAQQQGDATAKATGTAIDSSATTSVGAAVGFNYVNITSHGEIGDNAVITGNGVFVTALTPDGQENDVIAWGISAAGGTSSETSVAGSVGLNIVSFDIRARIGSNVTLNNTGGIGANASSPMGLQNVAAAGAFAGSGNAVGAAVALNIFTIHVDAVVDTNTHGTAGGAISVTAASGLVTLPIVVPIPSANFTVNFTNAAVSGAAGDGDAAIAGSVSINILGLRTRAWIADNVQINAVTILAGSSANVAATDASAVKSIAGALAATTGSAGVGAALIVDIIDKDTRAYIGKSVILRVAGDVSVATNAGMDYFGVSASAGASTSAAFSGSLVILVLDQGGSDGTRAYIDGGAATPTTVHAGGALSVTASAPNTYQLYTGQVAVASSAGIGVSVALFLNTGIVDAYIAAYDTIEAGPGGVTVSASQSEDITLVAVGGSVGGSVGIAGSAVIDLLFLTTTAHIDDHVTVTSGGKIAVSATDATSIKGVAGSLAIGGSAGVGLGVDVEVPQKDTEAWIGNFVNATAGGDVTVDATSSEDFISVAAGASVGGTAGVAVNAAVSVINVTTKATIGANTSVIADGTVRVAATETLSRRPHRRQLRRRRLRGRRRRRVGAGDHEDDDRVDRRQLDRRRPRQRRRPHRQHRQLHGDDGGHALQRRHRRPGRPHDARPRLHGRLRGQGARPLRRRRRHADRRPRRRQRLLRPRHVGSHRAAQQHLLRRHASVRPDHALRRRRRVAPARLDEPRRRGEGQLAAVRPGHGRQQLEQHDHAAVRALLDARHRRPGRLQLRRRRADRRSPGRRHLLRDRLDGRRVQARRVEGRRDGRHVHPPRLDAGDRPLAQHRQAGRHAGRRRVGRPVHA